MMQMQEKKDIPAQIIGANKFSLTSVFIFIRPSMEWMVSTHNEEGNLLYSTYLLKSLRNTLTDSSRMMFSQISGHHVSQSS